MNGKLTPAELMTVAAARELRSDQSCLVGVGRPSLAAMLAKRTHAPGLVLIYESGAIGADPDVVPLSIGDSELAATATAVVPVTEMFNYWLQPGRVSVGFLGAAQIDRFGSLNTTVIGSYEEPTVRLPGAGGAPEIAASCEEVVVIVPHSPRAFVAELDFTTSVHGGSRSGRVGGPGGRLSVVTDLGLLRAEGPDGELVLTAVHEGVEIAEVRDATAWPLLVSDRLGVLPPPSEVEAAVLRRLTGEAANQ